MHVVTVVCYLVVKLHPCSGLALPCRHVAAMAGCLKWFDQSQEEADEIEFIVAERDWNHYDPDRRFGRHKVDLPSNSILKVKIQILSHSGHMCLPETR